MFKLFRILFSLLLFTQVYCQSCFCDLTFECDVNCCCDPNCFGNDTKVFSSCINTSDNFTSLSCFFDDTVYVNNTETIVQIQQDGLFCIVTDNYASRNFFVDPPCLAGNTCFNNLDPNFSFENIPNTEVIGASYQEGDALIVLYDSVDSGLFIIPSSGLSSKCLDAPVGFLNSQSNSCLRYLTNFSNLCSSVLNYRTYWEGFRIFPVPENSSSPMNISVSGCVVNGVQGHCNDSVFGNDTCLYAVISVSYVFIVNDSINEISSASVSFVLKNLIEEDFPLTQTSSVSFKSLAMSSDEKAGNPGYIVGRPLFTAIRVQVGDVVENIFQNNILGLELSLINPSNSGFCSDAASLPRLPLLFGQNRQTGCKLPVGTDCRMLSALIKSALDGYIFDGFNGSGAIFVGTYGNSRISNLLNISATDWVQVLNVNNYPNPISQPNGCNNIVLGSRFDVIYANSGSLSNPQPKIIGVRYIYEDPEFVRFRSSNSAGVQTVNIFTSVSYIDISSTPISVIKQAPDVLVPLPSDFYFPLFN